MAFGEVFTALETKAIDAQENPYRHDRHLEVLRGAGYLSVDAHAYTPFMVLFSKPIFDSFSEEEQQILRECAVIGRDEQRRVSRELSSRRGRRPLSVIVEAFRRCRCPASGRHRPGFC
jgi:TRAP-type transport system periplasmic protein